MTRIKDEEPRQLTPTPDEVQQRLADQRAPMSAAAYSQKVMNRRAQTEALKGKGKPLGGGPPLDPRKMAASHPAIPSMPQPEFSTRDEPQAQREVKEPPPGVGAAYGVNQAMARGETEAPVSLREGEKMAQSTGARKPLSAETVEALRQVHENTEGGEAEESPDTIKVSSPETKEQLDDSEKELTQELPFDFTEVERARNKMISDRRRKTIEDRLTPMRIEDMIVQRELTQTIPIVPDSLSVTLRTFNQREHLFCLRYVYKYGGSQLYVEELLNTCRLACSLFAINGAPLPDHRSNVGDRSEQVDEKKFEDKLFNLASFPVQMLADFSVQMIWFNDRVNDLLSLDNLKNG